VWRTRTGKLALGVLGLIALLAVLGPLIAPYDPLFQNTQKVLAGPSAQHLLGTDYVGRDVFSRLLAGSTLSVVTAIEAVGIAFVVGVIPGLLSLYLGRPFEWATLRLMDSLLALPLMIFAIALAALLGNGLHQAMFAVGILLAPGFYRLTRAAALGFIGAQYVTAAELMGASPRWVLTKHVWRKILPVIVVTTANAMSLSLLIVASLTFLGIGVVPPTPTWGGMLATDLAYLHQRPYGPLFPSLLVMVAVGALNYIADSISDSTGDAGRARRSRRTTVEPATTATSVEVTA
jgi:peptide/nickel transport system permease protein